MLEFPKFNSLNAGKKVSMPAKGLLVKTRIENTEPKHSSLLASFDPTETIFRSMMTRIQKVNKDIKNLTSNNLKQTTFFDTNNLKTKKNDQTLSKKIKYN
jgi:hypothetical protein